MRRWRAMIAAIAVAAMVPPVLVGEPAALASTTCVFDPASGILTIAGDDDVTIVRTSDPNGRFQVSWPGLPEPTDCATAGTPATVENVDLVEVRSRTSDVFDVTLDVSGGPFAPGRDWGSGAGDPEYRDLFAPGQAEDTTPEIEFDVHVLPAAGHPLGNPIGPGARVVVLGSDAADHFVFGSRSCPDVDDPLCRDFLGNLNSDLDDDADLRLTFGEINEAGGASTGETRVPAVRSVTVDARGGDDIVSARGGAGTGAALAPSSTFRMPDTDEGEWSTGALFVTGGPGDDHLFGGLSQDLLDGGPGNDILDGLQGPAVVAPNGVVWFTETLLGGPGDDVLDGGAGDDVLDGGAGDDRFAEGRAINGNDTIRGGRPGFNVVDYSQRSTTVKVGAPDQSGIRVAGEGSEADTLDAAVDEVVLPDDPLEAPGGLRVHDKTLPALTGCAIPQNGDLTSNDYGPCPLVVDTEHNVGWSVGNDAAEGETPGHIDKATWLYDLETLEVVEGPPAPRRAVNSLVAEPEPGRRRAFVSPAIDYPLATHHDAFAVGNPPQVGPLPCTIEAFDYEDLHDARWESVEYECSRYLNITGLDAPLPGVVTLGGFFEEDRIGRSFGGPGDVAVNMNLDRAVGFHQENAGQPLIVRRLSEHDDGAFRQDWDLDLRYAGCGRRVPQATRNRPYSAYVGQIGDDLLAYCWDAGLVYGSDAVVTGTQGYIVRIPLEHGRPVSTTGGEPVKDANGAYANYRAVRTPTLPGYVHVVEDEASRQLLLSTEGSLNGNSVWVFDVAEDRFTGVVTGGATNQPQGNQAVGFDESTARLYMLMVDGILRVPTARRPLPAGQVFPVAANPSGADGNPLLDWANYPRIEVAPDLHRLFLPINFPDQQKPSPPNKDVVSEKGARFLVVDDLFVEPPPPEPPDPDSNTAQVDEGDDTEVSARAAGSASGIRVVVTGGITRTVESADPACRISFPAGAFVGDVSISLEQSFFGNGECAASQVLTSGHREFSLAASSVEAGSGSVAVGAPLAFDENDVTANDLKGLGSCEKDAVNSAVRGNIPADDQKDFAEGCDDFWDGLTNRTTERDEEGNASGARSDNDPAFPGDPRGSLPDPREGTSGRDGRGAASPSAVCVDFGSSPSAQDGGTAPLSSASAVCDTATTTASGAASTSGVTLAVEGGPLVSVARSASSVVTGRTAEGQVTVATSAAEGVVVGPVSIREVRSVAVTRAKGRMDTASVELERRWCGITVAGEPPTTTAPSTPTTTAPAYPPPAEPGCIDPAAEENQDFLQILNQYLPRVRLSVTEANGPAGRGEASPGGYEAVLIKDPDARGGDLVVNDDDTYTVAGLEVTVYNDGPEGRNRYVVQLAGVHAESRYGITLLPKFSAPEGFDGLAGGTPGAPGTPGTPGITRFLPGSVPEASAIVEGEVFEYIIEGGALAGLSDDLPTDPIRRFLRWLPDAVKDLLRLFIQHPVEFALLFLVFSLLGAPAYMAYRRRTFVGVVAG